MSDRRTGFYAPSQGYYEFVDNPQEEAQGKPIEELFLTCLGERFYSLGLIIRHFRQIADLTLRELARMADIDYGQLSRYENNEKLPRLETIRSLENALGPDFSTAITLYVQVKTRCGFVPK